MSLLCQVSFPWGRRLGKGEVERADAFRDDNQTGEAFSCNSRQNPEGVKAHQGWICQCRIRKTHPLAERPRMLDPPRVQIVTCHVMSAKEGRRKGSAEGDRMYLQLMHLLSNSTA